MQLFVRRVAELTDREVRIGSSEAAALGNAITQGLAIGAFATIADGHARI